MLLTHWTFWRFSWVSLGRAPCPACLAAAVPSHLSNAAPALTAGFTSTGGLCCSAWSSWPPSLCTWSPKPSWPEKRLQRSLAVSVLRCVHRHGRFNFWWEGISVYGNRTKWKTGFLERWKLKICRGLLCVLGHFFPFANISRLQKSCRSSTVNPSAPLRSSALSV